MSIHNENARYAHIQDCIGRSIMKIPHDVMESALFEWEEYCLDHKWVEAPAVLTKWRASADPLSDYYEDLTNRWGGITKYASTLWCKSHGHIPNRHINSHQKTIVLWESLIYDGPPQPKPKFLSLLSDLEDQFKRGELTIYEALTEARSIGAQQG